VQSIHLLIHVDVSFQVCMPKMLDGTTCADAINQNRYIENFTCDNPESTARMLKEMRLSFPSGHSSFSAYTSWRGSQLLRHFLQFLLIMLAWYTALSRISDYKHHWSDVLAGATLGALVAVITVSIAVWEKTVAPPSVNVTVNFIEVRATKVEKSK
jgi:phosphatidate phosphatase